MDGVEEVRAVDHEQVALLLLLTVSAEEIVTLPLEVGATNAARIVAY
jgi:hypothetical protein